MSRHLPLFLIGPPPGTAVQVCAALPLQSQIWTRVPLSLRPPLTSRHLPATPDVIGPVTGRLPGGRRNSPTFAIAVLDREPVMRNRIRLVVTVWSRRTSFFWPIVVSEATWVHALPFHASTANDSVR